MTLLYAHRGASAELPENTMEAFARAVELGVDVLETDAHVTRDSKVVLAHDDNGRRMANDPRFIHRCSFEEVRSWNVGWGFAGARGRFVVPSLPELLSSFPTMRFNIDLKAKDFIAVDRIVEVIRACGAEERVQLSSFHSANLRRVRTRGWKSATGLGQSEVVRLKLLPSSRVHLSGNIAQVPVRMGPVHFDTVSFLAKAHGLGLRVDYWVVNDPAMARRLVQLGADGIMTDDPALILPAVRA